MSQILSVDGSTFLSDDFYQNPFDYYANLQKNSPVYWSEEVNAWIVTRYQDILSGLKNPAFSAARGNTYFGMLGEEEQIELQPLQDFFSKWLLFSDGDFHLRLRKILAKSSFFRSNTEHKDFMRSKAGELLTSLSGRENSEIDIMQDYTTPLSVEVICKILGVSKEDFNKVFEWNMNIVGFMGSGRPDIVLGRKALKSYNDLRVFSENLIRQDYVVGESLLGDLVIYTQKGELTKDELIATFGNILIDGYEPSALSLGHGILALLKNPSQLASIQKDSGLIPNAIHEILRYENAFPYSARRATEEIELHGSKIMPNDRVLFILLAGNRDKDFFENPNDFNIDRKNSKDHVGLGAGHHACIGRGLVQTTLHTGLESFVEFSKNRSIEYVLPNYRKAMGFRGFEKLIIKWKS